jgi:hypothetical protein
MHMVAYENLRPSLSPNCMDSVRDLFTRCTSDDQNQRPTFEEIVQFLENNVRKETLLRAVSSVARSPLPSLVALLGELTTASSRSSTAKRSDVPGRGDARRGPGRRVARRARGAPRHQVCRLASPAACSRGRERGQRPSRRPSGLAARFLIPQDCYYAVRVVARERDAATVHLYARRPRVAPRSEQTGCRATRPPKPSPFHSHFRCIS